LSPVGWLPDRISIGVLTRVFTPELVDEAVDSAGAREQRRRLLPARLVVYFVLALWLFRGRNCGYGQVMLKLADGLYSRRLALTCWRAVRRRDAGGCRAGTEWWLPNVSSLSRGRAKLGPDVHRYLFTQVAGPLGADGAPGCSAAGCASSRWTGLRRMCRMRSRTASSSAGRRTSRGRGVPAGQVGGGGGVGDGEPAGGVDGRVPDRGAAAGP